MEQYLEVGSYRVKVSNLKKVFWPDLGLKKGDLIKYYIDVSDFILPHLKDRPLSLNPYPDGIAGKSFYQKRCPKEAPSFVERFSFFSKNKEETINWCLINNLPALIWAANRACIELHVWFSRRQNPDKPDFAVFDLDPAGRAGFAEAREVAFLIKKIMDELGLEIYPKTSGKRGLHLYIPVKPLYTYRKVRNFLQKTGLIVKQAVPDVVTLEWDKKKRGDKVYIDFRQNVRGKTLAAPYSLRPVKGATVSTPLSWDELENGINPEDFNILTVPQRLKKKGDLFLPVLTQGQILPEEFLK